MKYFYKAQIVGIEASDELGIMSGEEIIVQIFSYSQEGLEEEMGKKKWTEAIKRNEDIQLRNKEIDHEAIMDKIEDNEFKHGEERIPEEYDEETEIGGHIEDNSTFADHLEDIKRD